MITVNRRDSVEWNEHMTVQGLLDRMEYDFTLLTVTVNGKLIHPDDFEEFEIPDESDVRVIHLHHGG